MSEKLDRTLRQLEQAYIERTPNSKAAIEKAAKVLPGGDTRTSLFFPPYPLVIEHGQGSRLSDVDGNSYRDFLNDFGAGLYGHTQPAIQAAINEAVGKGLTLGGINQYEARFAKLLVERFPAFEKVRFTNSGSEATLMAITTARVKTGREKILVMLGGYHANVVHIEPYAARTNAPYDFVYGTFNDLEKTRLAVEDCKDEIAAILVEPMLGAGGCIPGEETFLRGLRKLADDCGALLIFDEVMTSRVGPSGIHGLYGITPDLMTCGKYLGGGGTFGAFGGNDEIMSLFDANRPNPIVHGGTFNNNVITMAAGVAGLRDIYTPERALALFNAGNRFRADLNTLAEDKGVAIQATGIGPLMNFHMHSQRVRDYGQAGLSNPKARVLLHMAFLERGIYMANRGFMNLSIALEEADLTYFKTAFTDVLDCYGDLFNEASQQRT